jgi:hypothetical protein
LNDTNLQLRRQLNGSQAMSNERLEAVCANPELLAKFNITEEKVRENQARLAAMSAAGAALPTANLTREERNARKIKLRAETCEAKLTAGYSPEYMAERADTCKNTQRFYSQSINLITTFGQKTEGCMSGLRFGVWGEWALCAGAAKFFAFMKVLRVIAKTMVIIFVNEHNTRFGPCMLCV